MTERTIRMTAKDLAAAYFEQQCSESKDGRFRKFWKTPKNFVGRNWPSFVPMAKTILTAMLTDRNTHQNVKDAIYEALLEENTKNANRKGVQVGRGTFNLNPHHPGRMERKLFHEG